MKASLSVPLGVRHVQRQVIPTGDRHSNDVGSQGGIDYASESWGATGEQGRRRTLCCSPLERSWMKTISRDMKPGSWFEA
jgi:hypothetical protein